MKDDITRIDEKTFYVKGSLPEPYLIFNSDNSGWVCDCMHFTMNIRDDGKTPDCKHIKKIKLQFNLE